MATEAHEPLILVVNDEEWTARSLESILRPSGYAVLKAYTVEQGLRLLTHRVSPDVIILDRHLPDMTGLDACRAFRDMTSVVRKSTPILVFTTSPLTRQDRLEFLRAGAWDVFRPPFDPEELVLKIGLLWNARADVEAVLRESHTDPLTGLYSSEGVRRRANEIAADARRTNRSVACLILGPPDPETLGLEGTDGDRDDTEVTSNLAQALARLTRDSDTVGRLEEASFVIVAPGTDDQGARQMASRLIDGIRTATGDEPGRALLGVGVYARPESEAAGAKEAPSGERLIQEAAEAFAKVRREGNGIRILPFGPPN